MNRQISAIISLKDRFSGPLLKMSDNVSKLDKETKSSMNRVNRWGKQVEKSMDRAVKATMKWAKRGAIVAGGWSLKSGIEGATELDYAARKVSSIAGDRLNLDDIKQDIKEFSFEFGKAYEEIGDGMYNAISASIPMDLLNESVELANQLSIAGFTDIDSSISLMASTMNAFDMKSSEEMQNMADQFLLTQNLGVITVDEMAQYYGRISTLSGQIGSSLEEQNAAIATMTMRGMTQRESVTAYRSVLNAFLKKSSDSQVAALEGMGLGSDFLTAKNYEKLGFDGVIDAVAKATKGDLDSISELFPDIRGKLGAIMFSPDAGMEDFKRILKELEENSDGVLDDAHATLNQSVSRQWDIFKERIKTLNDEIYTGEDGVGGYLIEKLKEANDWLDENKESIIQKMSEISESIIDNLLGFGKFIQEHKDDLIFFSKFLFGVYVSLKLIKGLGNVFEGFSTLFGIIEKIKGGELVSTLFGGKLATLVKGLGFGKVVAIIMAVAAAFGFLRQQGVELGDVISFLFEIFKMLIGALLYLPIMAIKAGLKIVEAFMLVGTAVGNFIDALKGGEGFVGAVKAAGSAYDGFFDGVMDYPLEPWVNREPLELFKDSTESTIDMYTDFRRVVIDPVTGEVNIIGKNSFLKSIEQMSQSWKNFRNDLANPVVKNPEIPQGVEGLSPLYGAQKSYNAWLGKNYKGTPNWKGGPTWIHERGGEIMDLPGGTRIYPHDESVKMARNEGLSLAGTGGQVVSYNFGDFVFSGDFNTDMDINEVGTKIVDVIKKELNNI